MACCAKKFSSEAVEAYSLNRLPSPEMGQFEEHLMICHDCQDAVTSADELALLFKRAAHHVHSLALA